jgi:hypothetical protein
MSARVIWTEDMDRALVSMRRRGEPSRCSQGLCERQKRPASTT